MACRATAPTPMNTISGGGRRPRRQVREDADRMSSGRSRAASPPPAMSSAASDLRGSSGRAAA